MSVRADLDPQRLLAVAGEVLDAVTPAFVDGLGAPAAVDKVGDDFATDVDLSLERRIGADLESRTGIAVHGEEYGGPAPDRGPVWILDPIDGTFNYSVGLPIAAMLLGLAVDGVPVLGLTRLPLLGMSFDGLCDGPLMVGGEASAGLVEQPLSSAVIGFGPFNAKGGGRYPGALRADLQRTLSHRAGRLRMTGSAGADAAFVAGGIFGGAVSFSRNAWDHVAGAAIVRAAGGAATDLAGRPWRVGAGSLVTGAPGLHGELIDVVADSGLADRDGPDDSSVCNSEVEK